MNKRQYQIIFCEAETGILLNENGLRIQDGQPKYKPSFQKLSDANNTRDLLLEKFVYGEVVIKDLNTQEVISSFNSPYLDNYLDEKSAFYKWKSFPFFVKWFKKKPQFKYLHNLSLHADRLP